MTILVRLKVLYEFRARDVFNHHTSCGILNDLRRLFDSMCRKSFGRVRCRGFFWQREEGALIGP